MSIGLSKRTPIRGFIITLIGMVPILVARPAAAAPPSVSADRAGQLERIAVDLAARLRAVPIRDGDIADPNRCCPRDRLAVSWTPPAGAFRFGAYIPPLGPAPGPATTSVNGVITCRRQTYAYMGFEARWTTGGWQVVDVPTLDDAAHTSPSTSPSRPSAAIPHAARTCHPRARGRLTTLRPISRRPPVTPPPKLAWSDFKRSCSRRIRPPPAMASRGTARSAAPASTRRAGPGTGAWR
jgi:hypothetical protein